MKPIHMLNLMRQVADTAGALKDITDESKKYIFQVNPAGTLYLQAEQVEIRVRRWHEPRIELNLRLKLPMGWRVAAEQDDVGVYVVARRKRVLGGLSGGVFDIIAPHDAHLILNMEDCTLNLHSFHGTLELPPFAGG